MLIVYRDLALIAIVCLIYLATYIDARHSQWQTRAIINLFNTDDKPSDAFGEAILTTVLGLRNSSARSL
jgi:hypothetical protein